MWNTICSQVEYIKQVGISNSHNFFMELLTNYGLLFLSGFCLSLCDVALQIGEGNKNEPCQ